MELQERIKSRREELNLSIRAVALALDVAPSTIMRYETNAIQNMGIDKIEALAKALRCSPAYLMGWIDEPFPSPAADDFTEDVLLKESSEAVNRKISRLTAYATRINDNLLDRMLAAGGKLPQENLEAFVQAMEMAASACKSRKNSTDQ